MAKQTFTTGSVLTATQMNNLQANDYNWELNGQTASYVLVAADAGKRVQMNAAGSTTITVNTGLFTAGDSVIIQNIGAGTCTVTAGTATVNKATNASLALAQYQGGTLYFVSASSAIFFPFDVGSTATAFAGVSCYKSASQSINSATLTSITFDSEHYDTDGFHSTVTNTDRITIPAGLGGKYLITGQCLWDAGGTGGFQMRLYKNTGVSQFNYTQGTSGDPLSTYVATVLDLVAGDYLRLQVYQASGSAKNAQGTDGYTVFQATKVG